MHRAMVLLLTMLSPWMGARTAREIQATVKRDDVGQFLKTLVAADNRGDLEAVVRCYAEDAVLMPPQGPVVRGRAAIRARYSQIFSTSRLEIALESEDQRVIADWAFSRGRTTGWLVSRADGSKSRVDEKFLMLLHATSAGRWEIHTLSWSPATAADSGRGARVKRAMGD